jgi:alpha-ketoglutarate-dependent taurine dioxygenase
VIQQRVAEHPPVEHPLVRTHPVTRRKSIDLSIDATVRIVGLEPRESDELIDFLYRLSDKPEHQVRWRWAGHDRVMTTGALAITPPQTTSRSANHGAGRGDR